MLHEATPSINFNKGVAKVLRQATRPIVLGRLTEGFGWCLTHALPVTPSNGWLSHDVVRVFTEH
jgi:hypothetical protein